MDEDMVYLQQQEIAELEAEIAKYQLAIQKQSDRCEALKQSWLECQAREAKLFDDIDRRLECAGITIYSGRPQRDDTALKEAIKQAKREAVNHILEMWHEPWPRTERRFIDRLEAYAEELK